MWKGVDFTKASGGTDTGNIALAVHASDNIICIFGPRCCVLFNAARMTDSGYFRLRWCGCCRENISGQRGQVWRSACQQSDARVCVGGGSLKGG